MTETKVALVPGVVYGLLLRAAAGRFLFSSVCPLPVRRLGLRVGQASRVKRILFCETSKDTQIATYQLYLKSLSTL
jgi:hypothetical protein